MRLTLLLFALGFMIAPQTAVIASSSHTVLEIAAKVNIGRKDPIVPPYHPDCLS
ncbi:MAG: hypothetical protein SAJ12_15390 [Jaaginema sp. PMC 1079.18]|nr:hypothetical protein [Jaaginema sp. PMC 1080.18]MEC4852367.1 hypothetical protein [Jaaginema sp. PMC 1079.18]MEC4866392.1 hypothetical protein [Jaaginema sp. PMC 1078.18]